ncbi:hypothetical protein EVAR_62104_1 [Eumeta japonica]|uniref:Tyrosine-protein kinase ephrin type A/B receptor-like domain-containing protein n=1 Tax=Eumeta variegata TaxID=151549 RepID=A0A4C1Z1Z4_EUMVA|nr:hypothetical protein EVAR_62104_1 [Eumeta japonica]
MTVVTKVVTTVITVPRPHCTGAERLGHKPLSLLYDENDFSLSGYSNRHHEFHRLSARMGHDDVDMVLACPAGFYLRPKYKICVACPANTHAEAGANECSPCPRGWHAGPGAARCRNPLCPRPRRYDCCARGRPIIVEWERDARHSAGLSLVR